jgi:N-methylhydantoinase B
MTPPIPEESDSGLPHERSNFDPVLLAVLANRFDTIVREMENTLLRTGRSAILNMARDFSCALITADNRLLASAEGLPVHVIGMEFLSQAMTDLHKDLREGDAYLHNDPYLGNTHPADHVILVPVFFKGKHVFTAAAKAHQADCGNSRPTTYHPYAKDVYEEGSLIFPCVLVQREYRDVEDIIRMCRRRIRVPEQWYGDYLAGVGAARIAERRLKELCARYGLETLEQFVEEWFDYSERRIAHVISRMPAGTIVGRGAHDPFGPAPNGIPINVKITVDPDAGMVELDLTDNIDCLDAGVNESRTCAMNNCMTGFLNSIDPEIPHNAGSFRRIRVKLRENCVVGIPSFPHSCSVATTNVGERLVVTTQRTIADHWPGYGRAEGACGIGAAFAVISGRDWRRDGAPYVNQMFLGSQGGPAGPVHDGWITYGNSVTNGLMLRDSVEVDEQKYPIRIREVRIRTDSEGAGRRRGAPGTICTYGPKVDSMVAAYVTDGHHFPPRGTQGGGDAAASLPYRIRTDGSREPLDPITQIELQPGELLEHRLSGGGGYGDPLGRAPERIREDVLARFVSFERAREVYGVVFDQETLRGELRVDPAATERQRESLRKNRATASPF